MTDLFLPVLLAAFLLTGMRRDYGRVCPACHRSTRSRTRCGTCHGAL